MARTRTTLSLSRLLGEQAAPIYVLDAERRIVFVNAACESWLSVRGEQLIGQRCDYHSAGGDAQSAIVAQLCPPPAAFRGELTSFDLRCGADAASPQVRHARCLRLSAEAVVDVALIVVVDAADSPPTPVSAETSDAPVALHARVQDFRREAAGRFRLDRLLGDSAAIARVRRQVLMAMHAQSRTVIVGPPGSGREHLARTMHFAEGEATAAPLMPLASALLDAEMLQASITAFARRSRASPSPRLAAILLLDADQLSAASQAELAGFLAIPGFDLHTLATARTSLIELAVRGEFRTDLALALSTLVVELPALAARKEDIPLLVQSLIEAQNAAGGKQIAGASSAALDLLATYDWPGNIDELAECIRHAHAQAAGPEISPADLPDELRLAADVRSVPRREAETIHLDELLARVEDEMIARALVQAKGNKTKAAELLGITRARLHRKLGEEER